MIAKFRWHYISVLSLVLMSPSDARSLNCHHFLKFSDTKRVES